MWERGEGEGEGRGWERGERVRERGREERVWERGEGGGEGRGWGRGERVGEVKMNGKKYQKRHSLSPSCTFLLPFLLLSPLFPPCFVPSPPPPPPPPQAFRPLLQQKHSSSNPVVWTQTVNSFLLILQTSLPSLLQQGQGAPNYRLVTPRVVPCVNTTADSCVNTIDWSPHVLSHVLILLLVTPCVVPCVNTTAGHP